jgi:hypothetical protein
MSWSIPMTRRAAAVATCLLLLASFAALVGTARIADAASSTYVSAPIGVIQGETARLGVVNPTGSPVTETLSLVDATGSTIATTTTSISPGTTPSSTTPPPAPPRSSTG